MTKTIEIMHHEDGTHPDDAGWIFVFGSNKSGFHGAGAALAAMLYYDAVPGCGVGLTGRAYAIPTKDEKIVTLPIDSIIPYIAEFARFTHQNPEMKFWVTRVGCGLAGFKDEQIAPLFSECNFRNCSFPDPWLRYLLPEGYEFV